MKNSTTSDKELRQTPSQMTEDLRRAGSFAAIPTYLPLLPPHRAEALPSCAKAPSGCRSTRHPLDPPAPSGADPAPETRPPTRSPVPLLDRTLHPALHTRTRTTDLLLGRKARPPTARLHVRPILLRDVLRRRRLERRILRHRHRLHVLGVRRLPLRTVRIFSWHTGQDGEAGRGRLWPAVRFAERLTSGEASPVAPPWS